MDGSWLSWSVVYESRLRSNIYIGKVRKKPYQLLLFHESIFIIHKSVFHLDNEIRFLRWNKMRKDKKMKWKLKVEIMFAANAWNSRNCHTFHTIFFPALHYFAFRRVWVMFIVASWIFESLYFHCIHLCCMHAFHHEYKFLVMKWEEKSLANLKKMISNDKWRCQCGPLI